MTEGEGAALRVGDGRDWHFVNGQRADGADGLLAVPEVAICTAAAKQSDRPMIVHYIFVSATCGAEPWRVRLPQPATR